MPSINYSDPRYQKALLAGMQNPLTNIHGLQTKIGAQFAYDQAQFNTSMQRLGLQRKVSSDRLNLANRQLEFNMSEYNKNYKLERKRLKEESKSVQFQGLFGLGTSIYSAIEGNRRAKATAELNALKRRHLELQIARMGA